MSRLPLIFAGLGLVIVLVAGLWGWSAWSSESAEANWPVADAAIDTCAEARNPQTGYRGYHFYAHMTLPDGQRHDYEGYSSSCTPGPYRVRHDPDDPTTLANLEGSGSYFAALIPAFIGLVFVFLGMRVWLASRRPTATPPPT